MEFEKIIISDNTMLAQKMELIKEKFSTANTVKIEISDSNWKLHTVADEYAENYLNISTAYARQENFDEPKQKAIQYYLENEVHFYKFLVKKIKRMLEFKEFYDYDFEPACKANELELPEIITDAWLQQNVKLIAVNILDKKENACLLEFDFAVYWDEEHGMRALMYQDTFLAFAQGGYVWSYDFESYDDENIEKIDSTS